MLGLTDRDLKQTRFYQEAFAKGKQEGELKGWQKGRQEGRQEEGMSLILRQLHRHYGMLAPKVKDR